MAISAVAPSWRPQSSFRRSMPGNAPRTSGIKCSRRAAYLGGYRQLPPNEFAVATCKDPRLSSVQSQVLPWAPGRNAQLKNCRHETLLKPKKPREEIMATGL